MSSLVVAGADCILTRDGRWILLEVNDHPAGLATIDALTAAEGACSTVEAVAGALAERARGDLVCLLLPDCFRVATPRHATLRGIATDAPDEGDWRTTRAVADFNAIASRLRARGLRAAIADLAGLRLDGSRLLLADGEPVGALYRRAPFPSRDVDCPVVNDIRVRPVCADKNWTERLLHEARAATLPGPPSQAGWTIAKPACGSASEGVRRLRAGDPALAALAQDRGVVLQEWIEPSLTSRRGREYYYDVRVYVVDGRPVGRMARLAAAPYDEHHFARSPLAWLTTTGRSQPLLAGGAPREDAVVLAPAQLDELDAVCTRAVAALDAAAGALSFEEAVAATPPFAIAAGIDGPLRYVELFEF